MTRSPFNFKSQSKPRIAIIGAGAAGLSCAFALSRAGADVSVFERGQAGHGALWASGGMLAAGFECSEAKASTAFLSLAQDGLNIWKEWAELLGSHSIGYRRRGTLIPGFVDDGWFKALADYAQQADLPHTHLAVPSGLIADQALLFPEDAELDNRLLADRLVAAVKQGGGLVRQKTCVSEVVRKGDAFALTGEEVSDEGYDFVILATGHGHTPSGASNPAIYPVKGQMLSLDGGSINLPACIRSQSVYLSQKSDRRIVIGATSEPGKADTQTDPEAISALRQKAEALLPALEGTAEIQRWAGVRPKVGEGLPVFDASPDGRMLSVNGLYRNGVLMSPAIATHVVAYLCEGVEFPSAFQGKATDR